jgi:DNA processing protein
MTDLHGRECFGLAVSGEIPALLVAIVGTRTPDPAAADAAFAVAKVLAQHGMSVISGLALGIDAAAHRGCLAGGERTVAVLGHGLGVPVYPRQHQALADTIQQRGALASPFRHEEGLTRRNLVARNRWIAALARAVWVVQTGVPGGALSAAAHARALGIPVLATPWDDPRWHAGFHTLLTRGAEEVAVEQAAGRLLELGQCARPAPEQGALAL